MLINVTKRITLEKIRTLKERLEIMATKIDGTKAEEAADKPLNNKKVLNNMSWQVTWTQMK